MRVDFIVANSTSIGLNLTNLASIKEICAFVSPIIITHDASFSLARIKFENHKKLRVESSLHGAGIIVTNTLSPPTSGVPSWIGLSMCF